MRKRTWLVLAGLLAIAMPSAAQTPAQPKAASQGAAKGTTSTAKKPAATARAAYDRALLRPSLLKDKAPDTYQVKFSTTRGDFTITVTRAWAPLGADRFYNLVKHRFFDNASFFRVVPGFVVQFGISAYPGVSAAWRSAIIKDDRVVQSNKKGFITYAMGGPNTRTTQLFISLRDNSRLDRDGFAPFGQVTEGMNVVEMLYEGYGDSPESGGTGPDQDKIEKLGKAYLDKGWPKLDSIKSATLVTPAGTGAAKTAPAPKKQ
jgi:peptidyl-prolyl cis-trans isomerase A (cyclophilin A)